MNVTTAIPNVSQIALKRWKGINNMNMAIIMAYTRNTQVANLACLRLVTLGHFPFFMISSGRWARQSVQMMRMVKKTKHDSRLS